MIASDSAAQYGFDCRWADEFFYAILRSDWFERRKRFPYPLPPEGT